MAGGRSGFHFLSALVSNGFGFIPLTGNCELARNTLKKKVEARRDGYDMGIWMLLKAWAWNRQQSRGSGMIPRRVSPCI